MKLGNLLIHGLIGVVIWRLAQRLFILDPRTAARSGVLAALVAAIWLLHPLNVSTVLYAVQRMAQLSALFALLALLAYVHGRLALERGNRRAGWAALFIATPLCVLAGVLSKENAVVAIGLCVAAELTLLRVSARSRTSVLSFHGLFLAMPLCAALALLWFSPERLVGGYDAREFTLAERLLSQPRALLDYLGLIVVPQGPRMGLYTDDFVASTGWLTPPSTAIAALIVAGLLVGALAMRRRFPIVAFGVLFFFAGHAIESTFLPLELYFEHRNYLPMIGILITVIGSFGYVAAARSPLTTRGLGLPGIAAVLFLGVLAIATTGRVLVWGSAEAIAEQGVRSNPESLRAHADLATLLEGRGEHAKATATMLQLAASERPRNRVFGLLGAASTQCVGGLVDIPAMRSHRSGAWEATDPAHGKPVAGARLSVGLAV